MPSKYGLEKATDEPELLITSRIVTLPKVALDQLAAVFARETGIECIGPVVFD